MTGILAHNILVVLACIVFMCGALWLDDGEVLSMTASLMVAAIALQTLWSVYLKTHDKGEASLLLDAGLLALMALAAAIANYLQAADPLLWLLWVVGGYTFCLFSITVIAFFKGLQNGEAIAYTRLVPAGIAYEIPSIGRVVTASAVRGSGIGRLLMQKSLEETRKLFGEGPIKIGAQLYLKDFYTSLGFIQKGEVYLEDGIEHIEMICNSHSS